MNVLTGIVVLAALSLISLIVYRLYLHPLAKVPGPWLAAVTSLHEFYYDCLKGPGGQHAFKIRAMHDQYGEFILQKSIKFISGISSASVRAFL